ncbi:hypothetical protein [Mycobacterium xenopi]|uniref:hypothetical protein n=1 Tax=Mycobacterium xenopi TaxID=1789 RepID=UPI00044F54C0|nr:hypothetical protein [Mycobacterium xenopi]EUA51563.1 hypothetical protein I552_2504 [Mycobacterium xenopi 3993]MDA3639596.1 hypothetical protein [Mycobacterium xenopi]MDA3657836.1 hypothetical protein [Mycobacterium xenopi]MDA3663660.1 hypothetical protein [Mycobacterium xenopi]
MRRTTLIDITRNEGAVDPVYLAGRGRDLLTARDRSARELGQARFNATIDMIPRVVRHIETIPAVDGISRLAGCRL